MHILLTKLNKKNIEETLTHGAMAFLFCLVLCLIMITIYGAVLYNDHLEKIDMSREIIRERSYNELNRVFDSFFYWDEMVKRSRAEDIPFLEEQLKEMKRDHSVVGLSIKTGENTIFSWGEDYPAFKTKPNYRTSKEGKLLVGKSFYMMDDEGNIQPDLEYKIWLDLCPQIETLEPFLLQFNLIPASEKAEILDKLFLGDTYVRTNTIDLIQKMIKKTPSIPITICLLSVLIYMIIILLMDKYSMKLSWSERLESLTGILEEKDAYTFGHGNRVAEYSAAIARELNLKHRDIKRITLAAQCHDIGKIFLPDEILNKREPLTTAEFKRIEQHPEDSERIFLNLIKDNRIGKIIRNHHERWDGKGYPDGLSGDEIPIEARIIAIADTFDAITSHRPYRSAMPMKQALSIIEDNSGSQFDPFIIRESIKALMDNYVAEKASIINYTPQSHKNTVLKQKRRRRAP